ncbi:MAG: PilZ domain-containing protein [Dorea sp.]|nr:PilZ domain-containing protein [Dorea sp.]
MRVVVEDMEDRMLFIANLKNLYKDTAELYQFSEGDIFQDVDIESYRGSESLYVKLRGFNDCERKAVFMEGIVTPGQRHVWQVRNLTVVRVENERSFTRLNTDIDAVAVSPGDDERVCRLLNISVGGASIGTEYRYHKGDTFLLKVKLSGDKPSVMYCEVLRVIEKETAKFEYGCRFLELTEADQEQITRSMALIAEGQEI